MNRSRGVLHSHGVTTTLAGLCLLGVLAGCPADDTQSTTPPGGSGGSTAGSGGSGSGGNGSGGSQSSSGSGGAASATGGSVGGGSSGGAGGTASGGAEGTATGGSGAGSGGSGSGGSDDAGTPGTADAPTGSPSDGGGGGSANNPCFTKAIGNDRMLAGLSPEDFCDGYEKYCMYTADGSLMSKCGPGQPVGPLYKDRADCVAKYTAASASAKACRAGQMCRNGKDGTAMGPTTAGGMRLIVNACSHATGYCAGACK
jgi:hypothetical protein